MAPVDTGIYLHIPFCRVKCPYCDFNSYAGIDDRIPAYVDALLVELDARLPVAPIPITTVYFGGGTPSLLTPAQIGRLLDFIASRTRPASDLEVTLEANPGTVDTDRLAGFRAAGVNRLTLGAQSFDPELLAQLGRLHDVADTLRAVDDARAAGFESLNLDLMFALPNQTEAAWQRDLDQATALNPEHLSLYNLTVEPGTPFAARERRGRLTQPSEESQATMYEMACAHAAAHGLTQYEVSNFGRPGHACRHNALYWSGEGWVAVGAGAHGFDAPPLPSTGFGRRYRNVRSPDRWTELAAAGALPEEGFEQLSPSAAAAEALMLGLRTLAGLDRQRFQRRFGVDPLDPAGAAGQRLVDEGLLSASPERLRVTQDARIITDSIIEQLAGPVDTILEARHSAGRARAAEGPAGTRVGSTGTR